MGNRVVFAPKPLTEKVERVFDFTSLLGEGEELAAAAVEVDVFSGTDAAPEDMLDGDPIVESPRVTQVFQDGIEGTVYTVRCIAGTCNGQAYSLAAYLDVRRMARE